MLGNAFEARQKTENDGKKSHKNGEQNGGENAANDTRDNRREITKPAEPGIGQTQL